jgi:membrane protein YdbS with pleckstrin-like domain
MAPLFLGAVVVNVALLIGRWYLEDLSVLAERVGGLVVFGLAWAIWPGLVAVFLYRTVTHTYRLTDRALLVDRGFLSRPIQPVPLEQVQSVTVECRWLARRLRIGSLEVRAGERIVRLPGVHNPSEFAFRMREAVQARREKAQAELAVR